MSAHFSNFLHFARWVSAWLVLAGHVRSLVFVDYSRVQNPNWIVDLLYFCTGFGHQAVMIFFVLSGYLVGGRVLREAQRTSRVAFAPYFVKRLTRLYIVFFFALAVGALLDSFGSAIDSYGLYTNSTPEPIYVVNKSFVAGLTPTVWLGNLLMLVGNEIPIFGSNAPIWSLVYEFWYYILAPFLALALFSNSTLRRIGSVIIFLLLGAWLGSSIMSGFLIWLMGATVAFSNRRLLPAWWLALGVFGASLVLLRFGFLASWNADFIVGAAFALLINEVQHTTTTGVLQHGKSLNRSLADFSYSLYLLHYPFMFFVTAVLVKRYNFGVQLQPNLVNLGYFVALLVMIIVYAYIGAYLTERNTPRVREYIFRVLGQNKSEIPALKST